MSDELISMVATIAIFAMFGYIFVGSTPIDEILKTFVDSSTVFN